MGFHQVGVNSSSEADCVNATAERRVPTYSNVKDSSVASVFNMGDIVVGVPVEDGMGLAVGVVVGVVVGVAVVGLVVAAVGVLLGADDGEPVPGSSHRQCETCQNNVTH